MANSPNTNRNKNPPRPDREAPVVTKTQARQGVVVPGMRYVLGFGILGVVIAFTLIYIAYFG